MMQGCVMCVMNVMIRGAAREEEDGIGGLHPKNKNPTQRCGE